MVGEMITAAANQNRSVASEGPRMRRAVVTTGSEWDQIASLGADTDGATLERREIPGKNNNEW